MTVLMTNFHCKHSQLLLSDQSGLPTKPPSKFPIDYIMFGGGYNGHRRGRQSSRRLGPPSLRGEDAQLARLSESPPPGLRRYMPSPSRQTPFPMGAEVRNPLDEVAEPRSGNPPPTSSARGYGHGAGRGGGRRRARRESRLGRPGRQDSPTGIISPDMDRGARLDPFGVEREHSVYVMQSEQDGIEQWAHRHGWENSFSRWEENGRFVICRRTNSSDDNLDDSSDDDLYFSEPTGGYSPFEHDRDEWEGGPGRSGGGMGGYDFFDDDEGGPRGGPGPLALDVGDHGADLGPRDPRQSHRLRNYADRGTGGVTMPSKDRPRRGIESAGRYIGNMNEEDEQPRRALVRTRQPRRLTTDPDEFESALILRNEQDRSLARRRDHSRRDGYGGRY